MFKTTTLKKLSLIFGILSAWGLVACLILAIDLPSTTTYNTVWGTVRSTVPGSFNILFLTPSILLAMGAYCGFGLFASIKCNDCSCGGKKEEKKEKVKEDVKEEQKAQEDNKGTFDTTEDPNV